jgi:hypothetical protein
MSPEELAKKIKLREAVKLGMLLAFRSHLECPVRSEAYRSISVYDYNKRVVDILKTSDGKEVQFAALKVRAVQKTSATHGQNMILLSPPTLQLLQIFLEKIRPLIPGCKKPSDYDTEEQERRAR